MNASYPNQKPGLLTAIAVMTLTSGIINLFWGFVASATALGTLVGIVCLPLTILPTILGIFEIIYAAKLLSNQPEPVQPSTSIAVLEILTFLFANVFSLVVGILALIFYNDLTVKEYFARLNGSSVNPVSTPTPQIAPVLPEPPSAPVEKESAPEKTETPKPRKKPPTRKVA